MFSVSDEELIDDFFSKGGKRKEEAFTLIYEKYVNFVYDFGRTMGIPLNEIDDFVQETFLKLSLKLKKFDGRKKFFPWFYSLVRNYCYDFLRKLKSKDTDLRIERYVNNPYDFDVDLINQVRDVISRLPREEREVIFLRYYQGMTPEEISRIIGCSVRKVYYILERAMRNFEEEWSRR
ncbi:MAG: sigma-70 family RNA polymerase sigma factor [Brevinematia bacterium]